MLTRDKKSKTSAKRKPPSGSVGRPSLRLALLEAAIDLIVEGGVESLTFESLAERTGLSKGGVLYHFPSRDELNRAVRQYIRESYRAARDKEAASLPPGPSRELKGWALATLHNRSNLDRVSAKIMTSGLWDSVEGTAHHKERFARISKGVGFDRAAIVYLATEGLWFLELAKFLPFTVEERQRVAELLLALADGAEIGPMPIAEPAAELDKPRRNSRRRAP